MLENYIVYERTGEKDNTEWNLHEQETYRL